MSRKLRVWGYIVLSVVVFLATAWAAVPQCPWPTRPGRICEKAWNCVPYENGYGGWCGIDWTEDSVQYCCLYYNYWWWCPEYKQQPERDCIVNYYFNWDDGTCEEGGYSPCVGYEADCVGSECTPVE